MTSPASQGTLASVVSAIKRVLGAIGLYPSQKWVAHAVGVGLTAAATALLPLGLSDQLNTLIVVVSGLVAHYLLPESTT